VQDNYYSRQSMPEEASAKIVAVGWSYNSDNEDGIK
jgi:hypothetical protein